MIGTDLPNARRLALSVVLGQAGVTVLAALLSWLLADSLAARSALAGGGIGTVASLVMAVASLAGAAGTDSRQAIRALLVGEAVKVVLVVALFVVVLKVMRVVPLAMFAAFAATFLVYWIALLSSPPPLSGARRGA